MLVLALIGIDGSGKTSQGQRLAETLREAGIRARWRRNAGGRRWLGKLAQRLGHKDGLELLGPRGLLLAESTLRWLAIARSLLTARLTGQVAVMDRYAVCQQVSLRVHGAGPLMSKVVTWAYKIFPRPTLIMLLDVTPEIALERVERRATDSEELWYLCDSRDAYHALAPEAVRIKADNSPDEVAAEIWATVEPVVLRTGGLSISRLGTRNKEWRRTSHQ